MNKHITLLNKQRKLNTFIKKKLETITEYWQSIIFPVFDMSGSYGRGKIGNRSRRGESTLSTNPKEFYGKIQKKFVVFVSVR